MNITTILPTYLTWFLKQPRNKQIRTLIHSLSNSFLFQGLASNPGVLSIHQAQHTPRPRRLRKIPQPATPKLGRYPCTKFLNPQNIPNSLLTLPFSFPFPNHSKPQSLPLSHTLSPITMSRPMCRLFTQRVGAAARLSPVRPLFRAPAARRFASGESGPNPKPGQSPFKVWPFVAITLLGTGSYILMARSRDGSCMLPYLSPLAELVLGRSGEGGE